MTTLTRKGVFVLVLSCFMILFGIFFRDKVMVFSSVALFVIILVDTLALRLVVSTSMKNMTVKKLFVRCRAGSSTTIKVNIYGLPSSRVNIVSNNPHVKIRNAENNVLEAVVEPRTAGKYVLRPFSAVFSSRLGLVEYTVELPLQLEILAYPRVIPVLAKALLVLRATGRSSALLSGGAAGMAGFAHGWEFSWLREYVLGDNFKLLDWKSSARKLELFVKETREAGGEISLTVNLDVHGPYTLDWTLSTALSLLLGKIHERGTVVLRIIHEGDVRVVSKASLIDALKLLVGYSMEELKRGALSTYSQALPMPLSKLEELYTMITGSPEPLSVRKPGKTQGKAYRKDTTCFVIGPITTNTELIVDLVFSSNAKVLYPPKPWLDAKNLSDAVRIYMAHKKALEAINKRVKS
jgi:hypothetical protein